MTKSSNDTNIAERKHKATSIKTVKGTGIQKSSSSLKKSAKHGREMSDEIQGSDNEEEQQQQPPKKKAKKSHPREEEQQQQDDAADDNSAASGGEDDDNDDDENPQLDGERKKSFVRKAPKIDVETLKQDPLMRPVLLSHEERIPSLESVPVHIKGYFEPKTKVWGNPDDEQGKDEKSTEMKRKRLQGLVDRRNDLLTKGGDFIVEGPINRIVAATIMEMANTRFSGLKYETKDKDGNMVSRKPMKASRKYLEALSKYLREFLLTSLHSTKRITATARRMTVSDEDVKAMFMSNSFLDHMSTFGHGGKKKKGTEGLTQLVSTLRSEKTAARAAASAANKAKLAERKAKEIEAAKAKGVEEGIEKGIAIEKKKHIKKSKGSSSSGPAAEAVETGAE